ncbi:hypothetical protein GCM10022247_01150 [Allokutzneria multivorans]|uniref:AB hydrolase-1 domain-containing protein n=1 Tax=Allokutzneria multivorans TaxID=1142134 RepID=A0ABP7QRN0_9PSEU
MIEVDGVSLCVESFGDPSRPALLLLAGTSCSMDWWPEPLCDLLADRGFFVIRYDQRDSGRSAHDEPGKPSYSLPDLAIDALGVLDAHDVETAHWVGFSSGGWVSQLAAVHSPSRVASLTLISTRPTGHGPADPDLPEVAERLLTAWESAAEPDWDDHDAVLAYLVDSERSLAGEPFDEAAATTMCGKALRRARDMQASVTNHPMADQGPRWRELLHRVSAPTLVLHGAVDPLFPVDNAHALVAEIPGARMIALPGVGHEIPPRLWKDYATTIADHAVSPS